MQLHAFDLAIIGTYLIAVLVIGGLLSRRAAENIDNYFLGGRQIPWYMLSVSNASGQFDIAGTMVMVTWLFVYGVKSCWIPWLWPTFNQVFLMIYLAAWLRRSNVLTGAEWLETRFSRGIGLTLAHLVTVVFAVVAVVAFVAYAFKGVGEFADVFLPWDFTPHQYAMAIMAITGAYVILGGMYSVVLTDVIQFVLLTFASLAIGAIAMARTTHEQITAKVPEGWTEIGFGWDLGIDWSQHLPVLNREIAAGGYSLFGAFVMMALFKGVLSSMAGPTPGYDMQRVLATRSPRESALMSGLVSPVLYVPRYFLITGIAVLAIVFLSDQLSGENQFNFERILPEVIQQFVPVGLTGVLLAGLLAAFMSTFDSTVNAGAAYLVNDIYKRYLKPEASSRHLVRASYACSAAVIAAGVYFGRTVDSINDILQWIAAGLYGGFVATNFLKWYWWRLTSTGFYLGLIVGVIPALLTYDMDAFRAWVGGLPGVSWSPSELAAYITPLNLFPLLLLLSGGVAVAASLLTRPESDATLQSFYRSVRPWGWWGPVRDQVLAADAAFPVNRDFSRDMLNCGVGIVWQLALTTMPIFVVLRMWTPAGVAVGVIAVTSAILKKNWYDRLE